MRISISQQIAAVQREIEKRKRVYPRLVWKGDMRKVEADYQIEAMQAVLQTLEWVKNNEKEIREWFEEKKSANAQDR